MSGARGIIADSTIYTSLDECYHGNGYTPYSFPAHPRADSMKQYSVTLQFTAKIMVWWSKLVWDGMGSNCIEGEVFDRHAYIQSHYTAESV